MAKLPMKTTAAMPQSVKLFLLIFMKPKLTFCIRFLLMEV